MKGFALVLLCIVAAAQARVDVQARSSTQAELGENPWVVHLRITLSTSGFLRTCTGSLIGNSWVLTSKDCLTDARFVWVRYGVVRVFNPEMVTENSQFRLHPELNFGLISINRVVHFTDNISPVGLATSTEEVDSGSFCGFGENNENPGELLNCYNVNLELSDDTYFVATSNDVQASQFDLGAALVQDGKQIGILTSAASDDNAGSFVSVADAVEWIEAETGLSFS